MKNAVVDEVVKKTEKKKIEQHLNKFDGLSHINGTRFFPDGTAVGGVNNWIYHKNKMFGLGKDTINHKTFSNEEYELPYPKKVKASGFMGVKAHLKDGDTSPIEGPSSDNDVSKKPLGGKNHKQVPKNDWKKFSFSFSSEDAGLSVHNVKVLPHE